MLCLLQVCAALRIDNLLFEVGEVEGYQQILEERCLEILLSFIRREQRALIDKRCNPKELAAT
jgi:hypothetical protein